VYRLNKAFLRFGIGSVVCKILGLGKMICLTYLFPPAILDLYILAFRIPNTMRALFAEGSLTPSFVSIYSGIKADREKGKEFVSSVFTLLIIVVGGAVLIGMIFSPYIIDWITSKGYFTSPETRSLTIFMTRIMLPYLLFMGIHALMIVQLT